MKDFTTPWDHRMILEIAMGVQGTQDILDTYKVPLEVYELWLRVPAFQKTLAEYRRYVGEEGLSFRAKAKIQAEDLLPTSYAIIHNPDTPANVKAQLIQWTAKMAGLDPQAPPVPAKGSQTPILDEAAVKALSDGDLEVQVLRILSRRKDTDELPALDGEVIDGLG